MDKEKKIEDLAEELEKGKEYPYINTPTEMAERLVTIGYGNVKQAVKEFADRLKAEFRAKHIAVFANAACNRIDSLITELYGKEN